MQDIVGVYQCYLMLSAVRVFLSFFYITRVTFFPIITSSLALRITLFEKTQLFLSKDLDALLNMTYEVSDLKFVYALYHSGDWNLFF